MSTTHQKLGILPGGVLDTVIDGSVDKRFAACIRITDMVWRTGAGACVTDNERHAWDDRYLTHLLATLDDVNAHVPV
jgi:hypothetical protein